MKNPKHLKVARKQFLGGIIDNTFHQVELTTEELVELIQSKLVTGIDEKAKDVASFTKQLQAAKDRLDFFTRAKRNFEKNKSLIRYKEYVK